IGGEDFYIDLLLYHRKLKCFVVIELKAGNFKSEYTGKMNMYLSALEKQDMIEGENLPIGIILCKDKNRLIVEYALKDVNKPIGVASYITKEDLPEDLKGLLPTLEEIEREMNLLD
ncbi:PDDEXK nuclease domain-containing protein, partial [Candidatus Vampirococcus lugosii]